jgi:predicted RecB family nuclease
MELPTPIKDHTRWLGIKSKTLESLKAINIETLEDLAESSIDTVRDKLRCTKERALVLINKSKRALMLSNLTGREKNQPVEQPSEK